MKLSLYTIVCNLLDYFCKILLNVEEYSKSEYEDELEFVVLDVSSEDMQIKVRSRLENISKTWNKKIIVRYYPYAKDPGIYNMRLDAVNYCTGDYIACIDGDDHFAPKAIEKIINTIKNNYGYDMYEYSSKDVNERNDFLRNRKSYNVIRTFDLSVLEDERICSSYCLWTHVIKSDIYKCAIRNLPRIYKTYSEDIMILFMVYKESKSYYGISDILHIRVLRSASDSNWNWLKRDMDSVISYQFTEMVYSIIDHDKLFIVNEKNYSNCVDIIKSNIRQYLIGVFRENDFEYLRHYCFRQLNLTDDDVKKYLTEDNIEYITKKYIPSEIHKFEEIYGIDSYSIMYKFRNNKTRVYHNSDDLFLNLRSYFYFLLDKYGKKNRIY